MFHYIKLIDPSLAERRLEKQALVSREQCCSGTFLLHSCPYSTPECVSVHEHQQHSQFPSIAPQIQIAGRPCWSVIMAVLSIRRHFFPLPACMSGIDVGNGQGSRGCLANSDELEGTKERFRHGRGRIVLRFGWRCEQFGRRKIGASPSGRFVCCQGGIFTNQNLQD